MSLKVKTRAGSSSQGKPRVYFCCFPADFEKYFSTVSEQILANANCAIYYYENIQSVSVEKNIELAQMQLFVMPVTRDLLSGDNVGLDDFRFAVKNHIPVLPLMQEKGLDKLFNQVCGDLQYLDPNSEDKTALKFEEKLKTYLETVLIGDELAQKIRASFDAYIFLSYRKKDRKYAQELMRLIHKNEFCRDIAIWYDEFLTPGENFNDSIKEALEKSKLFALVITPNMVNEPNYVVSTEYPMALNMNKTVVPAELVKTDRSLLKTQFAGLAEPADAHDSEMLEKALREAVVGLAIRENDTDPQHNFFIGLAYLGGVDVEVDQERALALITSAAEANLPAAMEKLSAMYQHGDGVERSYEKAVHWMKKLVDLCRLVYEQDIDDEENVIGYATYLQKLSLLYSNIWKFAEAEETSKTQMDVLTDYLQHNRSMMCTQLLTLACMTCSRLAFARGDLMTARKYISQVSAIPKNPTPRVKPIDSGSRSASDEMREEPTAVEVTLMVRYLQEGDICRTSGDYASAKENYTKGYDLCLALTQTTTSLMVKSTLAQFAGKLGLIVLGTERDFSCAEKYYDQAVSLQRQIVTAERNDGNLMSLATYISQLASVLEQSLNYGSAEELYLEALDIQTDVFERDNSLSVLSAIAMTNEKLGDVYKGRKKSFRAEEYYLKSVEICKKMLLEADTIELRRNLATTYTSLGEILTDRSPDEAEKYLLKAVEMLELLVEQTEMTDMKYWAFKAYHRLGQLQIGRGSADDAKKSFQRGLEMCLLLLKQAPGHRATCRGAVCAYVALGKACQKLDLPTEAKLHFEKAISFCRENIPDPDSDVSYQSFVEAHYGLAECLRDLSQTDLAKSAYLKCIELCRNVKNSQNISFVRHIHAESCYYLGNIFRAEKNYEESCSCYLEEFGIRTETSPRSLSPSQHMDFWYCCYFLTENYLAMGDKISAEKYCLIALEHVQEAAEKTKKPMHIQYVAVTKFYMWRCNGKKKYLFEAHKQLTKLVEEYPTQKQFASNLKKVSDSLAELK